MLKKLLITLLEIVLIALLIIGAITILDSFGFAEDLTEVWIICQPDDYINVRMNPGKKSQIVGYAEVGDSILTDCTKKNGYMKCYGIGEAGEGWIFAGYVVYDEPVEVNRMACSISKAKLAARKYIGGKVRRWLKNLDEVMVYWMTDEWSVTSSGFVRTEYLELDGV